VFPALDMVVVVTSQNCLARNLRAMPFLPLATVSGCRTHRTGSRVGFVSTGRLVVLADHFRERAVLGFVGVQRLEVLLDFRFEALGLVSGHFLARPGSSGRSWTPGLTA
jgi:hypothetical protein